MESARNVMIQYSGPIEPISKIWKLCRCRCQTPFLIMRFSTLLCMRLSIIEGYLWNNSWTSFVSKNFLLQKTLLIPASSLHTLCKPSVLLKVVNLFNVVALNVRFATACSGVFSPLYTTLG